MAGNSNYATLATTTLQYFQNEVFSNVLTNNALLSVMMKDGIKTVGGRRFDLALRHALNNTFAARSKNDVIPLTEQDNVSRSQWDIKVIDGSIALNEVDMAMNAGNKEKLIDLFEEVKDGAIESLKETLGDQLWSTAVGANDIDSIPRIIANSPTATSDVGGIPTSAAAQSYWRNQSYIVTVTGFATSQEGLNALHTLYTNCLFGNKGPTLAITTKTVWIKYSLALQQNARYTQMESVDGAFKTLRYADIPVYFDDNAPSARWYFIDTSAIKLYVLSEANMKIGEFREAQDALVKSALVWVALNLGTPERRTSGVATSITG